MLTDDGEASRKSSSRAPAALFWILRLVGGGDAGDEDGQESVQELIFRSSSISAALNPGTREEWEAAEGRCRRGGESCKFWEKKLGVEWT
jgi:hypothetical protein